MKVTPRAQGTLVILLENDEAKNLEATLANHTGEHVTGLDINALRALQTALQKALFSRLV